MVARILLIIALLPFLLFCGFGFLASGEYTGPAGAMGRSVYATLAVIFGGGIYWAASGLFRRDS